MKHLSRLPSKDAKHVPIQAPPIEYTVFSLFYEIVQAKQDTWTSHHQINVRPFP